MLFLDATFLTKKGVFCLHFLRKTSDFLGKTPKNGCARYVHTPKTACKDIPWKKYNPGNPQKVPKKWRKVQKTVYIFALFTPLFPQVLHTPPLIFRKHRRFRGARKRGFRAPKTPPGGIPGGRKGGFQNIGVSGGGLPLKGLCFGKGGCGAPDPPKGGSGGSGGGGDPPKGGSPRVPQTQ